MNETKTDDLLVDWGERPTNSDEQQKSTSNPNRIPKSDASEKLVRRWGIRRPNRHRPSSDGANDDDNGHLDEPIEKSEMRDECALNNESGELHVDDGDESDDGISYDGPCSSHEHSSTSSSEEAGEMNCILENVDNSNASSADEKLGTARRWVRRSLSPSKSNKNGKALLANNALLEEEEHMDDDFSSQSSSDIEKSKEKTRNCGNNNPQLSLLRDFNHNPNLFIEKSSISVCTKPMEGFGGGDAALNANKKINLGSILGSFQKRRLRAQADINPEKVTKQDLQELEKEVRANTEAMSSMNIGTEKKKEGWKFNLRRNLKNAALAPDTFVDKMLDEPDGDENLGWYGSVPTDGDDQFDVDRHMRPMKLDDDEPDWDDDYMLDECLGIDEYDEFDEGRKGYYGGLATGEEDSEDGGEASEDKGQASKHENRSDITTEHHQEIIQGLQSTIVRLQAELRLKSEEELKSKKTILALQEEIEFLRDNQKSDQEVKNTATIDLLDQSGSGDNLDEEKKEGLVDAILETDTLDIGSIQRTADKTTFIINDNENREGVKHSDGSLLDLKATVISEDCLKVDKLVLLEQ